MTLMERIMQTKIMAGHEKYTNILKFFCRIKTLLKLLKILKDLNV